MIDLKADLDQVFYAPDGDFAVQAVLRRPGEPDVPFTAQLFEEHEDLLGGSITSCTHTLRYPAHAVTLEERDRVEIGQDVYLVTAEPRPVADGREAAAPLNKQVV